MRPNITFHILPRTFKCCLQLGLVALSVAFFASCPSKTPVARTPAPPPPPAPAASIEVTPATAPPGQAVVISWKTENATDISIDPLGAVQSSGSKTVTPNESTTYRLTAKGPGGVQQAEARVTVVAAATGTRNPEEELTAQDSTRLDVFFDTNDYFIRPDQSGTIQKDAAFLNEHPDLRIVIEGHCDETGSTEYNLALGDRRAEEVKDALEKAGVNPSRMRSVSYGKEQQFCTEESEACWRLNRRAHIVPDTQPEARADGGVR